MAMVHVDTRSNLNAPIVATLEHEGIGYTQRFANRSSLKRHLWKTGDLFIRLSCRTYNMNVVGITELKEYFSLKEKRNRGEGKKKKENKTYGKRYVVRKD